MVRDDGARDGYNTRQCAGKGFRGRRDLAVGRREGATLLTSTEGLLRTRRGGKLLPAAPGVPRDGCCAFLLCS